MPGPPRLNCVRFGFDEFIDVVAEASGADPGWSRPQQVDYLISYLSHPEAGAKTIVCEKDYVDRHYLEEHVGYYATCLSAPPATTTRLHLLASDMTDSDLGELLTRAGSGQDEYEDVRRQLQDVYVGFVVVRPIPSCPIGRTILRTYRGKPDIRCYEPARTKHNVHLAGIELELRALPFQQQELAVGACATTALWSSLARAARADGARAPAPLSVTRAATRFRVLDRAFPALGGLDMFQMTAAIQEFGYSPQVLKPDADAAAFQLQVKCYIRSGMPVVLLLAEDGAFRDQHAIATAGFREWTLPEDEEAPIPGPLLEVRAGGKAAITAIGFERLYIHDDRVGPYARTVWERPAGKDPRPGLRLDPFRHPFDVIKPWSARISNAVVPLYPKIRLSAADLIAVAGQCWRGVRELVCPEGEPHLRVDLRLVLGGKYLRELYREGIAPARAGRMGQELRLSRYVGVVRFLFRSIPLLDVVCDTTDILRDSPPLAPVIAFFVHAEDYVEQMTRVAASLREGAPVY